MSQGGSPSSIGRANLIIGADTTPLEAELAGVKTKASAALSDAESAPSEEERYQLKLQELAITQEIERRERVLLETEKQKNRYASSTLNIKRRPDSILDYQYEDFEVLGYECHPAIKAPVAV